MFWDDEDLFGFNSELDWMIFEEENGIFDEYIYSSDDDYSSSSLSIWEGDEDDDD